jgi:hypothetical protein
VRTSGLPEKVGVPVLLMLLLDEEVLLDVEVLLDEDLLL